MNSSDIFRLKFLQLLMAAIGLVFLAERPLLNASDIEFSRDVRPILAENCFRCHGPDDGMRQAELRLDRNTGTTDWVAVIKRVASLDPDEMMPPPESGKRLKPREIETLRKWIADGAKYQTHWAFEPVGDYVPPKTDDPKLTEINRFIVAALDSRGLALSPPVPRTQLIRRATFDLTGLPPKWSDVQAFVNDPSFRTSTAPSNGENPRRRKLRVPRDRSTCRVQSARDLSRPA